MVDCKWLRKLKPDDEVIIRDRRGRAQTANVYCVEDGRVVVSTGEKFGRTGYALKHRGGCSMQDGPPWLEAPKPPEHANCERCDSKNRCCGCPMGSRPTEAQRELCRTKDCPPCHKKE